MVKTANPMTTWINLASIALGGAAGSVLRYLITQAASSFPGGSNALGTLSCNLIGCATIGAFSQYLLTNETLSEASQLAIRVGLLGGLTTFSSFALDAHLLTEEGKWGLSGLYVSANVLLGWFAVFASMSLVRSWTT